MLGNPRPDRIIASEMGTSQSSALHGTAAFFLKETKPDYHTRKKAHALDFRAVRLLHTTCTNRYRQVFLDIGHRLIKPTCWSLYNGERT